MGHKRSVPRIVAVAAGKGGVGKSTIAANLSLAIGRLGHRVSLVDADLGAANLHTMLGVQRPSAGLADFFDHAMRLDEAAVRIAPTVSLIPGTSRPGAANLGAEDRARLLRAIARLDTDCVVIDVGAGASFNVVDLVAVADIKLFVITRQLPAIHNAYALMKACVHRVIRRLAQDEIGQALVDAALGQESKARSVAQLVEVLRSIDGKLGTRVGDELARFGVGIIGNQLAGAEDFGVLQRVSAMLFDQLAVRAPVMGALRFKPSMAGGLKAGSGTIVEHDDPAYSVFAALAARVLELDLAALRGQQRVMHEHTMPLWIQRDLAG